MFPTEAAPLPPAKDPAPGTSHSGYFERTARILFRITLVAATICTIVLAAISLYFGYFLAVLSGDTFGLLLGPFFVWNMVSSVVELFVILVIALVALYTLNKRGYFKASVMFSTILLLPVAFLALQSFHHLQNIGAPPGTDPATYREITSMYTADKSHAYCYGDVLSGADPKTLKSIPVYIHGTTKADFMVDAEGAFKYDLTIDPEGAFEYAKDAEHVFYNCKELPAADPDTTVIVEGEGMGTLYAKDKTSVYFNGEIIYGADAESFRPVPLETWSNEGCEQVPFTCDNGCGLYSATDKNAKYCDGKVVR